MSMYSQFLGCLWTKYNRCTWNSNWTEMLIVSFASRKKTVWTPLLMSREIYRLEKGCNLFLEFWPSAGIPFPQNNENDIYQKRKHLDDIIFKVLAFRIRVFLQRMHLRDIIPNICICGFPFFIMREIRIILDSLNQLLFSFPWRIVEKLKDLMLGIWLKFGDLRCSGDSFQFFQEDPRLINSTFWVCCFAVLLKTLLNMYL